MSDSHALTAQAAALLAAAGIESARADARILLEHAAGDSAQFNRFVARRMKHEPVAYIIGHKEFWSLDFEVGPGALIPRPETETLIEEALKAFPDRAAPLEFLDLGAGSGCIILSALSEYPKARGVAVENSPDALKWLKTNIAKHGMAARCAIVSHSWNDGLPGQFDAVFANPPYVAASELKDLSPDVARYEPESALIAGPDGLDAYRELAPGLAQWLKPDGRAFLEVGSGQADAVSAILTASRLKTVQIAPDLAGIARCVMAARAA